MKPVISIIMGSKSDWATMQKTAEVLDNFGVAYEKKVVSAHRTPDLMFKHAEEARSRGIKVIIAGAGGAAHLPGMVAAKTTLPVIGVPVKSRALSGVDSLYSIVQMPGGVPVATMAIGEAGATNAALFALRLLQTLVKSRLVQHHQLHKIYLLILADLVFLSLVMCFRLHIPYQNMILVL